MLRPQTIAIIASVAICLASGSSNANQANDSAWAERALRKYLPDWIKQVSDYRSKSSDDEISSSLEAIRTHMTHASDMLELVQLVDDKGNRAEARKITAARIMLDMKLLTTLVDRIEKQHAVTIQNGELFDPLDSIEKDLRSIMKEFSDLGKLLAKPLPPPTPTKST